MSDDVFEILLFPMLAFMFVLVLVIMPREEGKRKEEELRNREQELKNLALEKALNMDIYEQEDNVRQKNKKTNKPARASSSLKGGKQTVGGHRVIHNSHSVQEYFDKQEGTVIKNKLAEANAII